MRSLINFLLGTLFLISGALKLMDPVGANFIVEGYLDFMHIGFLPSHFLAVAIPLFESLLGVCILSRVFRKVISVLTIATSVFFLLISLALVIFNPAMDCGCFGEAIHLTHIQTLIKNIAILLAAFYVFSDIKKKKKQKSHYVGFALASAAVIGLCIYSGTNIPPVDFTSYARNVDGLLVLDRYGNFTQDELSGGDILTVSVYDAEKMSPEDWADVSESIYLAESNDIRSIILIASNPDNLETLSEQNPVLEDLFERVFLSDPRSLATLNRSNGGYMLTHEGQVVSKWAKGKLPDKKGWNKMLKNGLDEYQIKTSAKRRNMFATLLLYSIAVTQLF